MRGFRHFTRTALLALVTSVGVSALPSVAQAAGGPVNQAPPSITGTPQEGSTLTEDPGFWASQYPWTESSQWEQCTDRAGTNCTPITQPTTPPSQYTLGPGDVGKYIVVVETATSQGVSSTASSAPVGIVTTTSTTALAVSPQPAITNQTETMVATVTSGDGSVSPSGTLDFLNGGTPIGGCDPVPVSPTGQTVTIACQTTFGASVEQLSAVFTPTPGSAVAGSTSAVDALSVGRDSTVTSLFVPNPVVSGEPTTFIAQVSAPAVRPGPLQPTGNVEFLNRGKPIKSCGAQPIGPTGAVCTITYISTGTRAITARYLGDGNFVPSASRPKPARVEARAHITSTMRWTFLVAPTYTRVLALLVQGALHTHVLVTCHRDVRSPSACARSTERYAHEEFTAGADGPRAPAERSTWLLPLGAAGSRSAPG